MPKYTKIGKTGSVKIDTTLLDNLVHGIDSRLVVRIGILGSKAHRVTKQPGESQAEYRKAVKQYLKSGVGADSQTNAVIGLAHEKGVKSRNLPRRSWLQEPLEDRLSKYYVSLGPKVIQKLLMSNPGQAYAELGLVCEIIIQKGFESGGYGKWKPLAASTIRRKGSDAILIDTTQLRRSVTSEVIHK